MAGATHLQRYDSSSLRLFEGFKTNGFDHFEQFFVVLIGVRVKC